MAENPTKAEAALGASLPLQDTEPDPRLDNRRGANRPKLEDFPAKPQQVDGGDVTDLPRNTKEVQAAAKKAADLAGKQGNVKGAQSPGPHGLGDTSAPDGAAKKS